MLRLRVIAATSMQITATERVGPALWGEP